jgi:hypothetical protein
MPVYALLLLGAVVVTLVVTQATRRLNGPDPKRSLERAESARAALSRASEVSARLADRPPEA